MIPKVIHYCWFGGSNLTLVAKKCIASWKKICPDYEIKRWDESNFDINCHPFVRAAYEAKNWAFVSDYARLKIIYDNGGIYLDTDVQLLHSLDFVLDNKCYIGVQQSEHLCATGLGFGAVKANPVVHRMLSMYDNVSYSEEKKCELTCPILNMKALEQCGYAYTDKITFLPEVTVYPCRYFDPIAAGDLENLLCEESVSIHLGSMSWMSKKYRLKRNMICLIGIEKIELLKNVLRSLSNNNRIKKRGK